MKQSTIHTLIENFESYSHQTKEEVEFWLARDLQHLLDYSKWSNFQSVISKAKTACELSQQNISDHFAEVCKTIKMPKGAKKEILEIMLTR